MNSKSKIIISILAVVLALVVAGDVIVFKTTMISDLTQKTTTETTTEKTTTLEDLYTDPVELKAHQILETMSLNEKIAQMFMYYIPKEEPLSKCERWQFGGYIFFSRNFKDSTPYETQQEVESYQNVSKIPMFMAVDEEGGGVNRISQYSQYRSEPFKSGWTLYASGGWDAVEADAQDKAQFLTNLGFNTILAPVADTPYSRSDYIYGRAFSTDADQNSEYVKRTVTTLNNNLVLSCVKHFPGYGNNTNTHTGMSTDTRSWSEFEERDLKPFEAGVEAGVPFIMVSHNVINDYDEGVPASLSVKLHNYIRNEMNYDGIILCDGLGMSGVKDYVGGDKGEVAVQAVLAGNDMLCATDVGVQLRAIKRAVEAGRIEESRIDESVVRILETKINYGLIEE